MFKEIGSTVVQKTAWPWPVAQATEESRVVMNVDAVNKVLERRAAQWGSKFESRDPKSHRLYVKLRGFTGAMVVDVELKNEESVFFRIHGGEIFQLALEFFSGPGIDWFKAEVKAKKEAEAKAKKEAESQTRLETKPAEKKAVQPLRAIRPSPLPDQSYEDQFLPPGAVISARRVVEGQRGKYGNPLMYEHGYRMPSRVARK